MVNKYFAAALLLLISTATIVKTSTLYPEDYLETLEPGQVIDNNVFFPNNAINLPLEIEAQPRPDNEGFIPASLIQALVVSQPNINQVTQQQIITDTSSNNSSHHSSSHTPSHTNTVVTPTSPTMPNAPLTRRARTTITGSGLARRNLLNSFENVAIEGVPLPPDTTRSPE
ncbi:hypothetical protein KJZ61_01585 [Candidatus Dependentiae bacterium]|nr:hypothetical protein [Candidatus Dependentiae bacterium]